MILGLSLTLTHMTIILFSYWLPKRDFRYSAANLVTESQKYAKSRHFWEKSCSAKNGDRCLFMDISRESMPTLITL